MKGMTERSDHVQVTTRQEYANQLAYNALRIIHMFKNGIAFNALKHRIAKWQ